jgi:hypothetical protein
MATVRLGRARARDILYRARDLWVQTNPTKDFSTTFGDKILEELLPKMQQAKESLSTILGSIYRVVEEPIEELRVIRKDSENRRAYRIPLSVKRDIPASIVNYVYGNFEVPLPSEHPVFAHCEEVTEFNKNRENQLNDYEHQVQDLLDNYPTLNQLLTAAPWISKLCDPDDIAKVHKKVDRTGKRKELHQLAEDEGKDLRETILTSSLLGDN